MPQLELPFTEEQLMEQAEFERDQMREDGPEPQELLEVLNKARAEMKEKGL